jgi:arylformamidase
VKIHDISPVLHEGVAVWPGDVGFSRAVNLSIADGANIDLSAVTTTVHVGAHADAPSHYVADGRTIDAVDLAPYLGPCQVLDVAVDRGARIAAEDVAEEIRAPRVLFRTGTFPSPDDFNEDFAAFAPETIDLLAESGVVLVGIDTPSVDLFDDKELVAHRALARHGMANLECLDLSKVPAGLFSLVALPLKIQGADASPVRAVLLDGV